MVPTGLCRTHLTEIPCHIVGKADKNGRARYQLVLCGLLYVYFARRSYISLGARIYIIGLS